MYTTYHFQSAADINADIIESIKTAFEGKSVMITVEEGLDETAFLLSNPANKSMLEHSIQQDRNGESVTVQLV